MIFKSYLIESNIDTLNKNFTLFYGENFGLKDDLKKKIKIKNIDSEIINFTQEDIIKNKDLLYEEISNISLFEKQKIIFIESVTDKILNFIEEIIDKKFSQKIIMFADVLEKKSKLRNFFEKSETCAAIACYEDSVITLRKIVSERLKSFKGLSNDNLNLIVNNCNLDRTKLNNELEKIETYFQDKNLEGEQLSILLNAKISENFNTLKDEALKGNKVKTNELLGETIIEQEKNIYYLNLINSRLNKLYEIRNNKQNSNVANAINSLVPPIFWKDKPNFLEQAQKWDKNKINTMLIKTYEVEKQIKTNSLIDKNILLKKLILDLCAVANS